MAWIPSTRLVRARWAPYRIPFRAPYVTARGVAEHRRGYVLEVETEMGLRGLGEASLDPHAPEQAVDSIGVYLEFIAGAVLGKDQDAAGAALKRYLSGDDASRAAHCAFETAIIDASCKLLDLPMAPFLREALAFRPGNSLLEDIPVNAVIGADATDQAAEAAKASVMNGFGCVKLKVGAAPTTEAEVERVAAVREAIGPKTRLRLDANGAWDRATAIERIRALERFRPEFVEQPLPMDDLEELGAVSEAVRTPLAADESAATVEAAGRVIALGLRPVVKPMRLGGPVTACAVQGIATVFRIRPVVTTTVDTGIATAVALHVAAAGAHTGVAHGLGTLGLLEDDLILDPGLPVENGRMRLPAAPGLGVKLDEAALTRYSPGWRETRL